MSPVPIVTSGGGVSGRMGTAGGTGLALENEVVALTDLAFVIATAVLERK